MAALVYISSMGVVLNAHFCKGKLKALSVFSSAEKCQEDALATMPADCPMHQAKQAHCQNPVSEKDGDKDCCDNKTQYLKDDQEQPFQMSYLDLTPDLVAALFVLLPIDFPETDDQTHHYLTYKPPLIVCDIPVSLQTFLC